MVTLASLLRRRLERPVGLCWGGFDFLHAGHILHFEFAKRRCRTLVVGLNADEAFPEKGPGRPALQEELRARVVAAVTFVDYVVVYRGRYLDPAAARGMIHGRVQSTPFVPVELIDRLEPEFYFKGKEYEGRPIPEQALVERYGGRMVYGPVAPVFSSTSLLGGPVEAGAASRGV